MSNGPAEGGFVPLRMFASVIAVITSAPYATTPCALADVTCLLFDLDTLVLIKIFFLFPFSNFFGSIDSSVFLSGSSPWESVTYVHH